MFRRIFSPRAALGPFRLRGEEVTRLEAFSDAVFAFAVTLLVVSLEVPRTFGELLGVMNGFGAFAISFAALTCVWFEHQRFFRRYGLHDGRILLLNSALLFMVLLYVFPLKFLSTLFVSLFTAQPGLVRPGAGVEGGLIEVAQLPSLMQIYALGFGAVNLLLGLMYLHARHEREALDLTAQELALTLSKLRAFFGSALLALLSAGLAQLGVGWVFAAGMIYFLIPLVYLAARRASRPTA